MLQKIGFFTICLGVMIADSDCLLIPLGVITLGTAILWWGERRARLYG